MALTVTANRVGYLKRVAGSWRLANWHVTGGLLTEESAGRCERVPSSQFLGGVHEIGPKRHRLADRWVARGGGSGGCPRHRGRRHSAQASFAALVPCPGTGPGGQQLADRNRPGGQGPDRRYRGGRGELRRRGNDDRVRRLVTASRSRGGSTIERANCRDSLHFLPKFRSRDCRPELNSAIRPIELTTTWFLPGQPQR